MDEHLEEYGLMEVEQRGAKEGCSGTTNNLFIDRMVTQDCHRGRRNLSLAWVDVSKAHDSVDHTWLCEIMALHRFPAWLGKIVTKLCASWNTKTDTVQEGLAPRRLVVSKAIYHLLKPHRVGTESNRGLSSLQTDQY